MPLGRQACFCLFEPLSCATSHLSQRVGSNHDKTNHDNASSETVRRSFILAYVYPLYNRLTVRCNDSACRVFPEVHFGRTTRRRNCVAGARPIIPMQSTHCCVVSVWYIATRARLEIGLDNWPFAPKLDAKEFRVKGKARPPQCCSRQY